jgi:hypothetical protein
MSEAELYLIDTHNNLKYVSQDRLAGYCGDAKIDVRVANPDEASVYKKLLTMAKNQDFPLIATPLGVAHNSTPEILKALLLAASSSGSEPKLAQRLDLLKDVPSLPSPDLLEELQQSIQEQESLDRFFGGYGKQRYVNHDRIHEWVSRGLNLSYPTFQLIVVNYTEVDEEKFYALPYRQKVSCLVEEALVLGIERWFIPSVAASTVKVCKLWNTFCDAGQQDNTAAFRLGELSAPGVTRDHPLWLAQWANKNYDNLDQALKTSLKAISNNMPETFWQFIQRLRA